MITKSLIFLIVGVLLIAFVSCDEAEWSSAVDANILIYDNKTNHIKDTLTPVMRRCKCDFSNCDCFIEYLSWRNGSKEARLYFRVDPNVPQKLFSATFYDNSEDTRVTFPLNDGMTCKTFKTNLFDTFCVQAYGRASYNEFNRICLQVGVIIKRDNVVSTDIECIKAWVDGATHMQPSAYENPPISDLNQHLYKLRYSSATFITQPSFMALIILSTIITYRIF